MANVLITLYVICLIGWLWYITYQLQERTKENNQLKEIKKKYDGLRYWLNKLDKEYQ